MLYQELHQRYGSHISKRIQFELSVSEFKNVLITELPAYLEMRAEAAHKEYQTRLANPFGDEDHTAEQKKFVDTLYNRWRDAEDLAYLVNVAEDVGAAARLVMANGKN